jgi:hypothetical protein
MGCCSSKSRGDAVEIKQTTTFNNIPKDDQRGNQSLLKNIALENHRKRIEDFYSIDHAGPPLGR